MYTSYNSCGSSDQEAHFFDSSTLHTFRARDVSTVSASSFIIVVTVAFIGLLMICAGSSSYYRRRLARNAPLRAVRRSGTINPKIPPQLWDIYLEEWTGQNSEDIDQWHGLRPMAMRVSATQNEPLDIAPPPGSRTIGRWLRGQADVVVLVAMPGTPLVPYVPHKTGHEAVGLHSSPKEDHLWSNYVVGVTQIPFPWSG